jgi:hypothetical protein
LVDDQHPTAPGASVISPPAAAERRDRIKPSELIEAIRPKQAGRTPLKINELHNDRVGFARLPKLDVAGSSPVARS